MSIWKWPELIELLEMGKINYNYTDEALIETYKKMKEIEEYSDKK